MTPGADKSREAAEECSPRRKAWVQSVREPSPSGAKEKFSGAGNSRAALDRTAALPRIRLGRDGI
jgi:hypothetical protein